jgi:hypothetical protein
MGVKPRACAARQAHDCKQHKFSGQKDSIMQEAIEIGYQVFLVDGGEEFGAVREVSPQGREELVIFVENAGDFIVPITAVEAVHFQKVILNYNKLEPRLQQAIQHAHDAEQPDA